MENIEPILKKIVEKLKQRPEVLAVYLFGSYAKGYAREDSDIDLGIMIDRPYLESQKVVVDRGLYLYGLQDELNDLVNAESSSKKIDVVLLDNAPITIESSIIAGRLLYCKNDPERIKVSLRISQRYEDLKDMVDLRLSYNVLKAQRNLNLL